MSSSVEPVKVIRMTELLIMRRNKDKTPGRDLSQKIAQFIRIGDTLIENLHHQLIETHSSALGANKGTPEWRVHLLNIRLLSFEDAESAVGNAVRKLRQLEKDMGWALTRYLPGKTGGLRRVPQ